MGITEIQRHAWTCDRCEKSVCVPVHDQPRDWTEHGDEVWCPGCSTDRMQDRRTLENVRDNLAAAIQAIQELSLDAPETEYAINHIDDAKQHVDTILEAYR